MIDLHAQKMASNCAYISLQIYQKARKTPSLLGRGYKRLVAKRQPNVAFSAAPHIA